MWSSTFCQLLRQLCGCCIQEKRARQVRDNKLNKSLSGEFNGEDDSVSDTSLVNGNGDGDLADADNNC